MSEPSLAEIAGDVWVLLGLNRSTSRDTFLVWPGVSQEETRRTWLYLQVSKGTEFWVLPAPRGEGEGERRNP